MISFTLPIKVSSKSNARGHWAKRHREAKSQRQAAYSFTMIKTMPKERKPCPVTLTRIRPKGARMLDGDNCLDSLKSVRDGIAEAFQYDDGDQAWEWRYAQEVGPEYAVRVEIDV